MNVMKFRWTIKELKKCSDDQIIRGIITERMSELNPYSSFKIRLQKLYDEYNEKINKKEIPKSFRELVNQHKELMDIDYKKHSISNVLKKYGYCHTDQESYDNDYSDYKAYLNLLIKGT